MQKPFRSNDPAFAGIYVGLSGDPKNTSKVVGVRMRVDDRSNGSCT